MLHLSIHTCILSVVLYLQVCISFNPSLSPLSICVYFTQSLCLSLYAPADWLRETSFVEEPSGELTVHEGQTLQVPCVINTAGDTNLSQVYWSGPQGVITGIHSIDASDRLETACQQMVIADRVFYSKMATNVSSDAGTLVQVSLNLHVCNAEQQDSGVYQCGVWTGSGMGEFRSTSITVEISSPLNGEGVTVYCAFLKSNTDFTHIANI